MPRLNIAFPVRFFNFQFKI